MWMTLRMFALSMPMPAKCRGECEDVKEKLGGG